MKTSNRQYINNFGIDSISKKQIKEPKISSIEYFLAFLMIVSCGFTNMGLIPAKTYIIILFCIPYINRALNHNIKIMMAPLILCVSYLMVIYMHKQIFNVIDKILFNNILLTLAGFGLFTRMASKFKYAYLNIMTVLAVISIFFFIIMRVTHWVPNIPALNEGIYKGIFLWNARLGEIEFGRNCGPFWEPGAYSGYLLLTFVFWFNDWRYLWQKHRKKIIVLVIALVTTFSSQGYISTFLLIFIKLILNQKKSLSPKKIIVLVTFVFVIIAAFTSLSFLQDKINDQLELADNWNSDASLQSATRFTTMMVDIYNINKSPIWGMSNDGNYLYEDFPYIYSVYKKTGGYGTGTGMTGFMAANGIPLFAIWTILSFIGLKRLYGNKLQSLIILLFLVVLGQGEVYISYIAYQSIPYLGLLRNKKNSSNKDDNKQ
jgi:hypothetical protein